MAASDAITGSGSAGNWMENSNAKAAVKQDDGLGNKETFLKLLVAQIRNQNPLNPQDGVQFLSQLAQFSDLEQTIRMREELTAIRTTLENQAAASAGDQVQTEKGS